MLIKRYPIILADAMEFDQTQVIYDYEEDEEEQVDRDKKKVILTKIRSAAVHCF